MNYWVDGVNKQITERKIQLECQNVNSEVVFTLIMTVKILSKTCV